MWHHLLVQQSSSATFTVASIEHYAGGKDKTPELVEDLRNLHRRIESLREKPVLRLKAERELIGVSVVATKREIRNAYRRASYRLQPDSGKPTADAENFKQVHDAYRKLLKAAPNE
jgi:DnaJ domain